MCACIICCCLLLKIWEKNKFKLLFCSFSGLQLNFSLTKAWKVKNVFMLLLWKTLYCVLAHSWVFFLKKICKVNHKSEIFLFWTKLRCLNCCCFFVAHFLLSVCRLAVSEFPRYPLTCGTAFLISWNKSQIK